MGDPLTPTEVLIVRAIRVRGARGEVDLVVETQLPFCMVKTSVRELADRGILTTHTDPKTGEQIYDLTRELAA
jgi:hypothetical protein